MLNVFNIFLIAALFCFVMLLVLSSLLRSGIPGIREWSVANALALLAFVLYAFGKELPPLAAYEVANGVYAAASAAMLVGFLRFFSRPVSLPLIGLGLGVVAEIVVIALFHYGVDSFAWRTVAVSVFQGGVGAAIGLTVLRHGHATRSRYPYLFTQLMALAILLGNGARAIIYVAKAGELTSLLQPSAWNLLFVSAGTTAWPVLTLGAVMMVHDTMMAKAEHAANRDFLTGAWSRRAFFEFAELELKRARRSGRPLSLLLLDVDHFKKINDTLGHAAGDRVLVDVVPRTMATIRDTDYLGRVGGEEFAVLLPETTPACALKIGERLRAALAANSEHGGVGFTVSIGVATLHGTEAFHELMRRADAALYAAKVAGRNRVAAELYPSEVAATPASAAQNRSRASI